MKKTGLTLVFLFSLVFIIQCTATMQKPDPKVMACKSACDTAYDECIKKAGTGDAKKTACNVAKTGCYNDCEKK